MRCLDCEHIKAIGEVGLCLLHRTKLSKQRAYCKTQIAKWRAANPEAAKELNKKHQFEWRQRNPGLNRLKARLGYYKAKQRKSNEFGSN